MHKLNHKVNSYSNKPLLLGISIMEVISMYVGRDETYEALDWLKRSKEPCAFACNRFGETKNAIEFVEHLYKFGAKEIRVRIDYAGGECMGEPLPKRPYADTLYVELPEDYQQSKKIIECSQGDADEVTREDGVLTLWWD